MHWKGKAGVLFVGLHAATGYALPEDEQIKTDCAKTNGYAKAGTAAYRRGDMARIRVLSPLCNALPRVNFCGFCSINATALARHNNCVTFLIIKTIMTFPLYPPSCFFHSLPGPRRDK